MNIAIADTNVVSILFAPEKSLYTECAAAVSDLQLFISFMTRAELGEWPRQKASGSIHNALPG